MIITAVPLELLSVSVPLIFLGIIILIFVVNELSVKKPMTKSNSSQPETAEELRLLLQENNVPIAEWGQGGAKFVGNLWEEIQNGESILLSNPLRRQVATVSLIIRRGDRILIETEQRLGDGRIRKRHIPPSEKLQQNEDFLIAAYRGLQEELNISPDRAKFKLDTHQVRTSRQSSISYPGLLAEYHIHSIEVEIPSLPQESFSTDEPQAMNQNAKSHIWDWLFPPPHLQSV